MPIIRTTTNHSCLVVFLAHRFSGEHSLARAMSDVSRYSSSHYISTQDALSYIKSYPAQFHCIQLVDKVIKPEFAPIALVSATDYDSSPNLTIVRPYNLIRVDEFEDVQEMDIDRETLITTQPRKRVTKARSTKPSKRGTR